jgi:thiamine-phosphate pyrophosphorylase
MKMAAPSRDIKESEISIYRIKGLYGITPDSTDTEDLIQRARQALDGGMQVLQYRNKIADSALRLLQARALRSLCREFSVTFIVNDDAQLAATVDADGVHLGATDGEVKAARALLGRDKLIGVSCYNQLALAQEAVVAGADYVAFGAFYSSSVKPNAAVATLGLLREARATIKLPIVAIGGIEAASGAALVNAGANALAVISAVFAATDIKQATQELTNLFGKESV